MAESLLQVTDQITAFDTDDGRLIAVDGVNFEVKAGQTLGIVGESGCGKSVTALSVMGLLPKPSGHILSGSIRYKSHELHDAKPKLMHQIRGYEIGMIFQEPMTALNPVQRIGRQVSEVFQLHKAMDELEALEASIEILRLVGIPSPEIRVQEYPHQLSGGMRQRVVIAMALACKPDLLIADEPTTALDVTIQDQILRLMKDLQKEMGMSIIMITHDLGVIAEICDEVVVMYAGRVVEQGSVWDIFQNPSHPYTQGLLASIPRLSIPRKTVLPTIEGNVPALHNMPEGCRFAARCPNPHTEQEVSTRPPLVEVKEGHWVEGCPCFCKPHPDASITQRNIPAVETKAESKTDAPPAGSGAGPILEVQNLKMHFPVLGGIFLRPKNWAKAVDGVSLKMRKGETLGLVGESGCGKSTLGKCIVSLLEPTAGEVLFEGRDVTHVHRSLPTLPRDLDTLKTYPGEMAGFVRETPAHRRMVLQCRRDMQMIFQDPADSLNQRHTVSNILEEPFMIHGIGDRDEREEKVAQLLRQVGLRASMRTRFPFEFSGGQRQRIGIARAIALRPKLIVCDEPVSALDVSVQSQVLNLMMDLQDEMGLSYLFIAHDLAVVRHISDRVAIMYLGKIVELADADEIYGNPLHTYTKALIAAIPIPDPTVPRTQAPIEGDVPSPLNPPEGCAFGKRVGHPKWKDSVGMDLSLREVSPGHWVQPCPCCTEFG